MRCQSRFDARYWMLGAGALGRPRGMVRGGRWEEGSGWGTYVHQWLMCVKVWQYLQYFSGFCHTLTWISHGCICVPPSLNTLPPPSPCHLSGSSQCTSPKLPISCIEPGLAIRFLHDIIPVSMPFSQIIPPSPSPTESKRVFYTSVSLLLSPRQGYCYHLSQFHIYALVYCIGAFLSGLLHSV